MMASVLIVGTGHITFVELTNCPDIISVLFSLKRHFKSVPEMALVTPDNDISTFVIVWEMITYGG
jgi:hypothetical protein